jgi:tRNA threonylcarbamoyladenosine biosynthesis protein TsaB
VLLLALDNAEAACSAALWDDARPAAAALLGHRRLSAARGQADHLIRLIDELLRAAGCDYAALGALAVNCGPGSFTGLRSVVAAARGLALAAGLPVIGVNSLEALVEAVPGALAGTLVAALDARRGQVYLQAFDRQRRPRGAPALMTPAEAVAGWAPGPLRLVGSGAPLLRAALPERRAAVLESVALDARWVASCAARRLAAGEMPQPGHTLRPLYLRPPDARPQAPLVAPARAQAVGA